MTNLRRFVQLVTLTGYLIGTASLVLTLGCTTASVMDLVDSYDLPPVGDQTAPPEPPPPIEPEESPDDEDEDDRCSQCRGCKVQHWYVYTEDGWREVAKDNRQGLITVVDMIGNIRLREPAGGKCTVQLVDGRYVCVR